MLCVCSASNQSLNSAHESKSAHESAVGARERQRGVLQSQPFDRVDRPLARPAFGPAGAARVRGDIEAGYRAHERSLRTKLTHDRPTSERHVFPFPSDMLHDLEFEQLVSWATSCLRSGDYTPLEMDMGGNPTPGISCARLCTKRICERCALHTSLFTLLRY